MDGPKNPDPRFLSTILREIVVASDPTDHGEDAGRVSIVNGSDSPPVTAGCLGDEVCFGTIQGQFLIRLVSEEEDGVVQ